MEKLEFISSRLSIATLSIFIWYIFMAIMPTFFPEDMTELLSGVGKAGFTIAIIQMLGLIALWAVVRVRVITSTVLNFLSLATVIYYFVITSPSGLS
ncbi:hypothetical protein [Aurantivibrio infirmus]